MLTRWLQVLAVRWHAVLPLTGYIQLTFAMVRAWLDWRCVTGAAFGCIGRIHPVTSCGGAQVVTALIHATHAANVARMFASIALVAAAACIRASMVRRNIHDCLWTADCGEWTEPSNTLSATTNFVTLLLLSCQRGYRVDTSSLHLLRNCSAY
jgi:hypothetical protein